MPSVEQQPRTKRSWWRFLRPRFSLRTMLAVITIVCLVLGMWVVPSVRQYRTSKQIERFIGGVHFAGDKREFLFFLHGESNTTLREHFFKNVTTVSINPRSSDIEQAVGRIDWDSLPKASTINIVEPMNTDMHRIDVELRPVQIDSLLPSLLAENQKIRSLSIARCSIGERGLSTICDYQILERLSIYPDTTGLDFSKIAKLKNLKVLIVRGSRINSATISSWASLPKLEKLDFVLDSENAEFKPECIEKLTQIRDLSLSRVTDEALKHVSKMNNIEKLVLNKEGVTERGLMELQYLTRLKEIETWGTPLTAADIKSLSLIKSLEVLDLNQSKQVNNDAIDDLLKLENLRTLNIVGTLINPDGARRLAALPRIEKIILGEPNCNDRAIAELNKLRPIFMKQ